MGKIISVIVPAYNEEETIIRKIKETIKTLESYKSLDYEIIIIDDGSTDDTYNLVKEFSQKFNEKIRAETYQPNQGKGNALKRGTLLAKGDYILYMDADLDIHPDQTIGFLKLLEESGADAVVGSKTIKGSKAKVPLKRKILSGGYYFLVKLLFSLPVTDTQTGFKLFRKRALAECISRTSISGYAFDLELLAVLNAKKYKTIEGPVKINQSRMRRINLRDVFLIFRDTILIFTRFYITKSYI